MVGLGFKAWSVFTGASVSHSLPVYQRTVNDRGGNGFAGTNTFSHKVTLTMMRAKTLLSILLIQGLKV